LESAPVIIFVGALVFLAHLFVALFERTRIPDVLYLVLIGLVIGPGLHIVSPDDFGKLGPIFTTIALVVILFEGGLELSVESLKSSLRGTLVITLSSYLLSLVGLTWVIQSLTDFPFSLSLFAGAVLAGPAPAVVIPLVRQLRMTPSAKTMLTLESPLAEALAIIVALAILDSMRLSTIHVGFFAGRLLSSLLFALIFGTIGGFLWSLLLHKIRQLRFAIFTTPAFLFILYGLTEFLGFSGAVSALAFGITLGNAGMREIPWLARKYHLTPLVHDETEKAFFGEIVFLIKTFFFVYLGLSVNLTDFSSATLAVILCSVLLFARLVSVRFFTSRSTTGREDASLMGVMIPRGTAAVVLGSIPLQLGLAGGEMIQNTVYAVTIVSILLTAVLIFLLEKTALARIYNWIFRGYRPSVESPSETSLADGEDEWKASRPG
jgi:cell volume regulation protein A